MLLPLLGAFFADSYLGPYRMIIVAYLLYILGLGLLTLSPLLHSVNSSDCKKGSNHLACNPPQLEIIFFFVSLYLVALAQGGHKPCVQDFGADQFDEEDSKERRAKSSFFNWWYFSISAGVFVARSVLNYVQENLSWELGFGIPCVVMCFALVVFLLGSTTYRFLEDNEKSNPFVRIGHVFVKAVLNRWVAPTIISIEEEASDEMHHEHIRFKFLDKPLIKTDSSKAENVCSINDVDDAKAVVRLVPIWCTCLAYAIVFSQTSTLFTKQETTLDRHITSSFQIPSASLQSLGNLSIIFFIPIYDRIVVPLARIVTKNPTGVSVLQRIGVGIFLSFVCMIIAAVIEKKRLTTADEYGLVDMPTATIPMSIWWLAPQYLLLGVADVFTMVGLQEFFYDQVLKDLKSIGLALYLSIFGVGSFLSGFLISIVEEATSGVGRDSWFSNNLNRAHLDYFYWLLAGITAVSMVVYVYFARSYVYNTKGNF